jgi:hypothetical protein
MSKPKATAAKAVKEANKRLDNDLTAINDCLRSVEGLAELVDIHAADDDANRIEELAIGIKALVTRAGILVDRQLQLRDGFYRGWLDTPVEA